MSGHGRAGQSGWRSGENTTGDDIIRAAVRRSLCALLTIGTGPHGSRGLTPVGLTHSVGVAFLEMAIMTRGKGKESSVPGTAMPRFVDVRLSQEQKAEFSACEPRPAAWVVDRIQQLVFAGYRFGCSWSGEHQSYTVSMTCRDAESPNNGLCMTSFAGQLLTALRLAIYKHDEVCRGRWTLPGESDESDFG